ncbi:hypothetical protein BC829DRAFT_395546 [Chytridium lagenaria]|nr:hypothetical protein BC829DRAFT_395546 [Chytridium lagenaria]
MQEPYEELEEPESQSHLEAEYPVQHLRQPEEFIEVDDTETIMSSCDTEFPLYNGTGPRLRDRIWIELELKKIGNWAPKNSEYLTEEEETHYAALAEAECNLNALKANAGQVSGLDVGFPHYKGGHPRFRDLKWMRREEDRVMKWQPALREYKNMRGNGAIRLHHMIKLLEEEKEKDGESYEINDNDRILELENQQNTLDDGRQRGCRELDSRFPFYNGHHPRFDDVHWIVRELDMVREWEVPGDALGDYEAARSTAEARLIELMKTFSPGEGSSLLENASALQFRDDGLDVEFPYYERDAPRFRDLEWVFAEFERVERWEGDATDDAEMEAMREQQSVAMRRLKRRMKWLEDRRDDEGRNRNKDVYDVEAEDSDTVEEEVGEEENARPYSPDYVDSRNDDENIFREEHGTHRNSLKRRFIEADEEEEECLTYETQDVEEIQRHREREKDARERRQRTIQTEEGPCKVLGSEEGSESSRRRQRRKKDSFFHDDEMAGSEVDVRAVTPDRELEVRFGLTTFSPTHRSHRTSYRHNVINHDDIEDDEENLTVGPSPGPAGQSTSYPLCHGTVSTRSTPKKPQKLVRVEYEDEDDLDAEDEGEVRRKSSRSGSDSTKMEYVGIWVRSLPPTSQFLTL